VSGALIARGFFSSGPVGTALVVGAVAAVVCAAAGVFTVIRGQSFAGEALADIGTAGGSAAYLAGAGPLWGFVVLALAAAGAMELAGVQRARGRDLATGVVLGLGLGLAALFLYLDSTSRSTTGAAVTILFGSIFTIDGSLVAPIAALSGAALALLAAIRRPLLLSSLHGELAAARGIRVRRIGALYLAALAIAVAMAAMAIGTILSTALLVGPAASALRITRSPGRAVAAAAAIGTAATWLGVLLAYDSHSWPGHNWPVSFFVVVLILLVYMLSGLARRGR
jgi:zinc/manganese transport system permease protein